LYIYINNHDGYKIKQFEMGGACGTYEGEENCLQSFGREAREKETVCKT
jgi:hypothetical protein